MCIQYGIYFSFIFLYFNERIFCIYPYNKEKKIYNYRKTNMRSQSIEKA